MRQLFFFIFLAGLVIFSCKKSSTAPSTCTLSSASLVGSWGIYAATYKPSSTSAAVDILHDTSYFYACESDNYTTFNSNGTYNYVDAGIVCNPSESVNGIWSLNDSTLITTISGSNPESNPITSFSCSTIIFTYTNFYSSGDVVVLTYKKRS